jgi:tetratricopeptide (TPR) repeat protein
MSAKTKSTSVIDLDAFNSARARLQALVDDNPTQAIADARKLPSDKPIRRMDYTGLKACILVDAGSQAKNRAAIEEGIALFKKLLAKSPGDASYHYNLGNGLTALADLESFADSQWYLKTAETRRRARSHFQKAISSDQHSAVLSTSFTNLGNALFKAHRWVEAYDAYHCALDHDNSNAVAATGAARVLLRCVERGIGDRHILQAVAARHLKTANLHPQRLAALAGIRAEKQLAHLMQTRLPTCKPPDLRNASDYQKFVARHRLALSLTIEGLDCSLKRWDSLRLKSVTEEIGKGFGVPPLFAMLNVMKSDFLAARFLAYEALSTAFPESGLYADTLDYAVYGMVPSFLALAQRACIDLLDKIAAATTEYFRIPGNVKVVYFWSRWFEDTKSGHPLAWHPSLRPHIDKSNTALIALAEISLDMGEDGFLLRKKAFRHASTHRFTVLHDIGCHPSRQSSQIEHSGLTEFKAQLIESLQLARAALIYFVEMVSIAENARAATSENRASITVPNHHCIRGESPHRLLGSRRRSRPAASEETSHALDVS